MTKELQDRCWQSLPKEARVKILFEYSDRYSDDDWIKGWNTAFRFLFGTHNLTSDPAQSPNLSQETANCDKSETENNDMEEKELNLAQLLTGCEGQKFYSPTKGVVKLNKISTYVTMYTWEGYRFCPYCKAYPSGFAELYPSEESFRKYPLDGAKAWAEWAEARKPKRWRAEKGEEYYFFNGDFVINSQEEDNDCWDDSLWKRYNYFRDKIEAQEAIKVVKKALKEFHERKEGER